MSQPFTQMFTGGHRNSLGRTEEVVQIVTGDPSRLAELFACLDDADEVVRMRAGDALEKVCRVRPEWFEAYLGRILDEVAEIDQPSVQWHVAQILQRLRPRLSSTQAERASALLQRNLRRSHDWIVLNVTMDVLAEWAAGDPALGQWLRPQLERLSGDERKAVAKRATKRLAELRA